MKVSTDVSVPFSTSLSHNLRYLEPVWVWDIEVWLYIQHYMTYDNTYNRCITIHKTSSSNVYMYLVNQYISNIPVTYDEIYKVDLHHYLIGSKVVQLVIFTMFTWRLCLCTLWYAVSLIDYLILCCHTKSQYTTSSNKVLHLFPVFKDFKWNTRETILSAGGPVIIL